MAKDSYHRRRNLWSQQIAFLSPFFPYLSVLPSLSAGRGWWTSAGRWRDCCSLPDWAHLSYGHIARDDDAPRCTTAIIPSGSQEGQPLDRLLRYFYSSRAWGVSVWLLALLFLGQELCIHTAQFEYAWHCYVSPINVIFNCLLKVLKTDDGSVCYFAIFYLIKCLKNRITPVSLFLLYHVTKKEAMWCQ